MDASGYSLGQQLGWLVIDIFSVVPPDSQASIYAASIYSTMKVILKEANALLKVLVTKSLDMDRQTDGRPDEWMMTAWIDWTDFKCCWL